ncbi:bifunctional hydroxymethylpyrimidine kinase/phosphomethylpyrimidine kinase [Acidisoma cellulosilytica]|uniref:hydroxymethylpyrimidine kinase n=1 Tax=Acidisoma cellulosilyticum TaxID=2802395 RepID=A0A963Z7W1_9PROT|nr:bifunctional hydroxymethylpyrimidine kinase/phosphomethylpyrimidine kinase [Acidisoma cellulosilyticum]MCB8883482.1 bifunctional hydroxymethylpyrimidine kinase/phosphomethylpyrimidine kinase [Acidisoma cellulosilyticum]
MPSSQGRVLVIAGSDSGGGAGIQADIKSVMALGGFATTALTALTAQNTRGVTAVLPVPPDFLTAQIDAVMSDIGADAIKTGMLPDTASILAVADFVSRLSPRLPFVMDPVMVATSGDRLQSEDALAALKSRLLPLATVITPNIPEAELLLGRQIRDEAAQREAAQALLATGAQAVLVKGGHLTGETLTDLLATRDGIVAITGERIASLNTHGTGCTLASAIATGLAQGMGLEDAIRRACAYVAAAIRAAPGLGGGHGPLGHNVTVDPSRIAALRVQ